MTQTTDNTAFDLLNVQRIRKAALNRCVQIRDIVAAMDSQRELLEQEYNTQNGTYIACNTILAAFGVQQPTEEKEHEHTTD